MNKLKYIPTHTYHCVYTYLIEDVYTKKIEERLTGWNRKEYIIWISMGLQRKV